MKNNNLCIAAITAWLGMVFTASADIIPLTATMDCAAADAGAGTCAGGGSGTGTTMATLDDTTNLFSWTVQWSGLSAPVSVAHFHGPALPNQGAGVQVTIDETMNPSMGSQTLSAQQVADLLAGLWYVNIHSDDFPLGEIRGQVSVVPIPAAAWFIASGLAVIATRIRRRSTRV